MNVLNPKCIQHLILDSSMHLVDAVHFGEQNAVMLLPRCVNASDNIIVSIMGAATCTAASPEWILFLCTVCTCCFSQLVRVNQHALSEH